MPRHDGKDSKTPHQPRQPAPPAHYRKRRAEHKADWDPESVIRTLSAITNGFRNLDGGYVVLGETKENSWKATHLKVLAVSFIGLLQFLSYNQRQLRGIFNG